MSGSEAPVLVTYATRFGSTGRVAEDLAEALRAQGLMVEVKPVGQVDDLTPYRAVVVGGPVYMGKWLGQAARFVREHRDQLRDRPTAYFTVGMLLRSQPEAGQAEHRRAIEKVRRRVPEVEPVAVGSFVGALDRSKMGFFFRLVIKLTRAEEGDFRDRAAIQEWAMGLAGRLMVPVS